VPLHDAALRRERDDGVDTEFDQGDDGVVETITSNERRSNGEARHARLDRARTDRHEAEHTGIDGLDLVAPPRAVAIGSGESLPRTQPPHPSQVVAVGAAELDSILECRNEDVRCGVGAGGPSLGDGHRAQPAGTFIGPTPHADSRVPRRASLH
jgi:hypothetical protein